MKRSKADFPKQTSTIKQFFKRNKTEKCSSTSNIPGPSTSKDDSREERLDIEEEGEPAKQGAAAPPASPTPPTPVSASQKEDNREKSTKKSYHQRYITSWESLDEFKGWLCKSTKSTPGSEYAFCKVCDQNLACGKSELLRHAQTSKHVSAMNSLKSNKDMRETITTPLDIRARRGELKWAAMLAEKNLPLSLIDTIIPLAENIYSDSQIASSMKSKRTKTSCLIKNVLAPDFKRTLCEKLRNSNFSLIMDETTDCGSIKQCAFSVVYYDKGTQVKFLEMVECEKGDANHLFKTLKDTLAKSLIPMGNIVGFCSDSTNVMAGAHSSVFTRLKDELPQICLLKCSSHQLHLASSWACKKIPKNIEDLLRDVYAHFHRSFQRQVVLREFQEFYNLDSHQILGISQTRWLSMKCCIDRVLEQFDALTEYFSLQVFEDPSATSENILTTLKSPETKCYLEFLSYVLDLVNGLNTLFQTNGPVLMLLQSEVNALIKTLSQNFIIVSYVKRMDASKIDPHNEDNYLPLHQVYIGVKATETISELCQASKNNFYTVCRYFYVTLVFELQKRFTFEDDVFSLLEVLDPQNVTNLKIPSLSPVHKRFSGYLREVKVADVDKEWRTLSVLPDKKLGFTSESKPNTSDFWKTVFSLKNEASQPIFQNLEKVLSILLCLPSSNAAVERIFSQLRLIKTNHRNKLHTETVEALMLTKEGIGSSSINFEPSTTLLKKKWK